MRWKTGECLVKMDLRFIPVGAIAFFAALIAGAYASEPSATAIAPPAPNPAAAPATPAPAPVTEAAPAPAASTPAAPAAPALTQAQLDQLLAPIALYPDQLLGQVLMASTYPLEVVAAARWVNIPAHRKLKGDALINALKANNWDCSVMALVPFPRLLKIMSDRLEWMQQLGNAFLAQQADVMAAVQRLRHQAMLAGNLQNPKQCRCMVETSNDVIVVRPADPQRIYLPVWNSRRAYGQWVYPDYPPVIFPVPVGYVYAPGGWVAFDRGIDLAFYGPLWGWSSIDWGGRAIIVDPGRYAAIAGTAAIFAGNVWVNDHARRGRAVMVGGAALRGGAAASRGRGGGRGHVAKSGGQGGGHGGGKGH